MFYFYKYTLNVVCVGESSSIFCLRRALAVGVCVSGDLTGEMAQLSKALVALPDGLDLIPIIHMADNKHL